MNWKRILLATCMFAGCALSGLAQDLSKLTRPEDSGFSTERLARITTFFQGDVDKGAIPGAVVLLADVRLLAPIPRPPKIICIGLNYRDHAAETGAQPPAEPVLFLKAISSITGPRTGFGGLAHYAASKAGLEGFVRSAAGATSGSPARPRRLLPPVPAGPGEVHPGERVARPRTRRHNVKVSSRSRRRW